MTSLGTLDALLRQLVRDVVVDVVRTDVLPVLNTRQAPAPEAPREPPLLMSVERAAHALDLSVGSVRRLISDGHLQALSIGRLRRIERAELERFVASAKGRTQKPPVDTDALADKILSRHRR